ncbi:virion structural protein [Vibrio phage USC-1]|uniref:Uncharacterized protein n=2 Tax=Aphroditevirus USC1 TaxID=2846605 RepID=A0A514A2I1_9CAUD|nr:virion structural protein [Vibrio phage USC-1]QCW23247.1 hypothetical protein [Vibrio phage 5 TSL-2019]QDH47481.1 hypothetical protein [Vibrio phage USC-1]
MPEQDVSSELAALSVVSSTELAEQAKEGRDLVKLQEDINNSIDRVEAVKTVLGQTEPKDVTQLFGNIVDRQLERVGIRSFGDSEEVAGVESLGHQLTPKRYLETRIAACESFLTEFMDWSRSIAKRFYDEVLEQLVLMKDGHDTLTKRAKLLQGKLNDKNTQLLKEELTMSGTNRVLLLNNKVPEDIHAQILRFVATTRAITSNFYRVNQANTNEIISYFGGFSGLNEEQAIERLLKLPRALSKYQFKEAMFNIREQSNDIYQTRASVTLLGDRRYINTFLVKRDECRDLTQLKEWVELYRKNERIKLEMIERPSSDVILPSFDKDQIDRAIRNVHSTLRDVEGLFKEGDRYLVDGAEYKKMLAMLSDVTWSESTKTAVGDAYIALVLARNNEQVRMRSDVVKYTTLVMNAILNVCEASME